MKNMRLIFVLIHLISTLLSYHADAQITILFPRPPPKHVVIDFEEDEIIVVKRKPEENPEVVTLTPKESEINHRRYPINPSISNRFFEGTDLNDRPMTGLTKQEIEDLTNNKILIMSSKAADELKELSDDLNKELKDVSIQFAFDDEVQEFIQLHITQQTLEQLSENGALIDELNINVNTDDKAQFSKLLDVQFDNPKNLVFQSHRAQELNDLKERLDQTKPQVIYKQIAKKEAYVHLQKADRNYVIGFPTIADVNFDTARLMLDIVTDFVPIISEAKDAIRGFAGKDPITGESIGSFERGFALGCLGLAFVTLGGSRYFKGLLKKALIHSDEALGISKGQLRKSLNIRAALKGHKARVLLEGHKDGVVLIGRDMENVKKVAAELRAEGIDVRIFDGEVEIGKEVKEEWLDDIKRSKSKGGWLEDDYIINNTKIFPKNKEWINERMLEGYNVVDLGNYKGDNSVFYDMELAEVGKFKEAWKR